MKYKNIREEELKNKIGVDWFEILVIFIFFAHEKDLLPCLY